jgi:hypothetical protein
MLVFDHMCEAILENQTQKRAYWADSPEGCCKILCQNSNIFEAKAEQSRIPEICKDNADCQKVLGEKTNSVIIEGRHKGSSADTKADSGGDALTPAPVGDSSYLAAHRKFRHDMVEGSARVKKLAQDKTKEIKEIIRQKSKEGLTSKEYCTPTIEDEEGRNFNAINTTYIAGQQEGDLCEWKCIVNGWAAEPTKEGYEGRLCTPYQHKSQLYDSIVKEVHCQAVRGHDCTVYLCAYDEHTNPDYVPPDLNQDCPGESCCQGTRVKFECVNAVCPA